MLILEKLSLVLALFVSTVSSDLLNKIIRKRDIAGGGCDRSLDLTEIPGTGCSKFFRCDGERLFVFDCGPGTLFDSRLKVCNWPHLTNCPSVIQTHGGLFPPLSRIINNDNNDTSEDFNHHYKSSYVQDCVKLHFTASSQNCSTYYLCNDEFKLVSLNCPSGTLWDNSMKNCNWQDQVVCNSLLIKPQLVENDQINENTTSTTQTLLIITNPENNNNSSSTTIPTTTMSIPCPEFEVIETKKFFCGLKSFRYDYPNCCNSY